METIKAPTKLKALKLAGFDKIYWKGNTPHAVTRGIYTSYVYAIKIANGEFFISEERVN
jgi:hypothetical protein